VIYISSYEGFGLPLVEAMTSGTLGIVTNSSAFPEVGGTPSITTYVQDPTDAQ
jgi:alpha-1,3-rhamnosyl/mannosyltransferase